MNLYSYVGNNPVRWIDSLGLSPEDVEKIKAWASQHYGERQESGQSIGTPEGDGTLAAWARGAATNLCSYAPGSTCEGCGDAANDALAAFNEAKAGLNLDDDWTATNVDDADVTIPFVTPRTNEDPNETHVAPHSYVGIESSNPSDPSINVDAHRSQTRIHPR